MSENAPKVEASSNDQAGRSDSDDAKILPESQPVRYGASQKEWRHWSETLDLTSDLLPVVSNPNRKILSASNMKTLGKTPSRLNGHGRAVGILGWTKRESTLAEIVEWSKEPDYGLCLQTRTIRAFDIDDETEGFEIELNIASLVGVLPKRSRDNSEKRLMIFQLPGDLRKRVIKTEHGIIEFLASGQQFVACGTHPSGSRYQWEGGLPVSIPELTLAQVETVWSKLKEVFEVLPPQKERTNSPQRPSDEHPPESVPSETIRDLRSALLFMRSNDYDLWVRIGITLKKLGDIGRGLWLDWSSTSPSFDPAEASAKWDGFKSDNTSYKAVFAEAQKLGWVNPATGQGRSTPEADFEPVGKKKASESSSEKLVKYKVLPFAEFLKREQPSWLIKDVIPQANLGVVFGASGAGKTFMVLDLCASIAQGVDWCGHKSVHGRVVYICAEGQGGFVRRCQAYAQYHGLDPEVIDILVIPNAPDLRDEKSTISLARAIKKVSPVALIVIDTLAASTQGCDENSSRDMGVVLGHCRKLSEKLKCLVILVHHSGKDQTQGARGWSGLRAAVDFEAEVIRNGESRALRISKQKDGEDGLTFGFELQPVVIGVDEDGLDITSCVVEHKQGGADHVREKTRRLGRNETLILESVKDAPEPGLTFDDAVSQAILIRGESFDDPRKLQYAKANLMRAITSLHRAGWLVIEGDFVKKAA